MRFGIRTLDELSVRGKTVLCRVDVNKPVDRGTGTLKSVNRIAACVPTIRELSEKEIRAYVATGEPMDKAGAYGIQGGAALFAEKMVGDYYNVMGLPVCKLHRMLTELAPELF